MADWQVDSYHISLGVVGDSSIHLISQKGGKMDRLILRGAMLVDGGAHGGDDVVMRTIKYIESSDRYDWCKFGTKGEHSLKFHVVIITHWDEDHHTGIMYAIDKNLKSKWKVQEPNPRVDFFRYDENDKPTTILYCPEVGFKTRSKPKFIPKPPEAVLRTISFMMSTGVIVKDVVQIQVEPPCRDQDLEKMPASIIGLELVKGHALKRPKDRLDMNTPSELLEYHREKYKWTAEEARLPHIFIVAASGSFFAPKDPDAHIKVVKEKEKKTWPTAKNRSSIACMIIWDSGVGERPQIAQYFGGDLPWFIEERIVKWTGMNGRRDDKGSWVPVVKLSHHGAKSSTPSLMLNSFNPRHLIASVADRNGHPSWELTFYLVPWLLNGGLSKASCPPLLATQYPYYLARYVKPDKTLDWMPLTKGPANQMNMDILLRKGTEGKEYMNELKTLWSGMSSSGIKLSGPEDLWIDAKKKDTTLEPRGWARGYVEQRWETLSPTKPSQHAATSGQAGHGAVATDPTGRLEFFLVETTASVPDGGVHVKYSVSTHLEKLWPKSSWDSPAQSTIDIPEVLGKRGPLRLSTDPEGVYGTTIRKMVKAKGLTYDEDTYIAHGGTNPGESDFNDGRELEPESELDLASPVLLQQDLDNMLPPILDPQPEPGIPDDDRIIQKPYLYLCSSIVDFDDTVEPEFVKKIDKEHDQDDFLSVLHTEGLVLEDRPKPDETSFTRLHLQDETQTWLSLALRWPKDAPDPLLASVKVDMGTGGITDFLVTFPYAFHSKEAPKAILNFSSAATRDVLGAPPDHGSWGLGAGGILRPMSLLILGLDKASVPSEVTLQDIFAAVQARSGSENDVVLDVLLKMYGETAKFNLDASTGSRSCLWFDPASAYHTILRLQYSIKPDSLSGLNYWIDKTLGLKEFEVANARLITKAESTWTVTSQEMGATNAWSIVMMATCKLGKEDPLLPKAIFEVQVSKITITLQLDKQTSELDGSDQSQSVLDKLISWVTGQWNCEVNFQDFLTGIGMQNFNLPVFRRLILVIGLDPKTGSPTGTVDVNVGIELGLKFGVQDPGGGGKRDQVVFFFTFRWSKGLESQHEASFRGLLWGPPCPETLFDSRLLPSYEPHLVMEPITMDKDSKWTSTLDLENLMPTTMSNVNGQLVEARDKVSRIPKGVPKLVTKAMLEISNKSITFEGALGCEEPDPENIPSLILSRIDLRAQYIWAPSRDFHLEFGFGATMFSAETTMLPIELRGSLKYDTAGWSVSAGLETTGAKGAHFLDFFDVKPKSTLSKASSPTQMASSAAALVQHIQLNYLELEYLYNNPRDHSQKNAAKEFHFKGSVSIGNLELNLQFDYTGKELWTFKTTALASGSEPCTIKEMIDSITADGSIQLPACISGIEIDPPAEGSTDGIVLQMQKMKSNSALALGDVLATAEDRDLIFTASVSLSGVSLTFIQFRNSAWEVGKKPSKRFIKLAASKLPDVVKEDIPVLEKITQPFDELYFMYVQDGVNHKGFTKAEVDAINDHTGEQMIFYKPRKKDHDAADVVVESGCHFVLVMKDKENKKKVVVDYVFARPKSEEKVASPALALRNHVLVEREYGVDVTVTRERLFQVGALQQNLAEDEMAMLLDDSQRTKGDGSTSKAALKKTMGPLSISNIGLRFKENKLSVCMDASVVLGPTTLDLLGFSIDLDLSQAKFQGKFDANMIGVSLQGLAVALEKPPLTVAGGLFHEGKYWAGGVDIAWAPWNFMAGGGYGSVPGPNGEFKSAFVLAALDGPLLTLQYAIISGVTGGFGYNTAITLPRVEEIPTFPFIQMPKKKELLASGKSGAIEMMESLVESKWFKPQVDEFWVAAGLTVTAFQMLQVKAVVVVNWGKEVRLGIFAVAVADVPSTASPFKIAHVEMGILATINFDKGVAKIEAQLAPSSFILDPSCHLTGGMALYYWFKDGPEQIKGDTVLTLGGYHPAYKPPTQYPNPPRLGIAWSLGPLSITGSAYFAMTPKVAMAGVQLHASLTIGVLHAFLDAWADFLINYRPFMFTATAGVAVGVRFTLDKWFVTIHINVQIGARLFLQGPPFKGICHVDFWVFGFDIAFGSQGIVERPDAISLLGFYCLALQKGSPSSGTTPPVPHLYTCMGGLIPAASPAPVSSALTTNSPPGSLKEGPGSSKDEPAAKEPWRVAAGTFAFAISSVFALSAVSIRYSTDQVGKISKYVPRPQNETSPVFARPMHLQHESLESTLRITITLPPAPKSPQPSKTTDKDGRPNWGISVITDSVPRALWDKYDPSSDPSGGSRALLDSSNPNVTLMTGIKLTSPDPDFSDDKIAPFDAVASQISDVVLKPVALPDAKAIPDKSWAPVEPVEPLPENPAKAWKDVQDLWDTPKRGKGAGVKAVEAWASVMEWKCGKGDGIKGGVPVRLVDGIQELYVSVPLVATG